MVHLAIAIFYVVMGYFFPKRALFPEDGPYSANILVWYGS